MAFFTLQINHLILIHYISLVNLSAVNKAVSTQSEPMQEKQGNKVVTKRKFCHSEWYRERPKWQSNTDKIKLHTLWPNTQNKIWKRLRMMSELRASFPSPGLGRLVQPVGWGSPPRREQQPWGQGPVTASLACCLLIFECVCLAVLISFFGLDKLRSLRRGWQISKYRAKSTRRDGTMLAGGSVCSVVLQGGERAPRADTTLTAQITGFLLPSVPYKVDPTNTICKTKL